MQIRWFYVVPFEWVSVLLWLLQVTCLCTRFIGSAVWRHCGLTVRGQTACGEQGTPAAARYPRHWQAGGRSRCLAFRLGLTNTILVKHGHKASAQRKQASRQVYTLHLFSCEAHGLLTLDCLTLSLVRRGNFQASGNKVRLLMRVALLHNLYLSVKGVIVALRSFPMKVYVSYLEKIYIWDKRIVVFLSILKC